MQETDATPIGVIGLGIMGRAIAQALLEDGYAVWGHDVDHSALAKLEERGGHSCDSTDLVAAKSRIVLTSLPNSESLIETARTLAATASRDGSRRVVIETSTLPLATKEIAARMLQAADIELLDCPISGTGATLKNRTWALYCSGDEAAYREVHPILRVLADTTPYVGDFGSGTKMKIAANHLVAIYNVAYAESANLVRKLGLDRGLFLELVANGAFLGTGVMRLHALHV